MSIKLERFGKDRWVCPTDPGLNIPEHSKRRISVTDEEGKILQEMATGKIVLEIGTGLGVSTRWMAKTADSIITVDIDPWVMANVWPFFPDNVVPMTSWPERIKFELIFIDGDHREEAVIQDATRAAELLVPGGKIVYHDCRQTRVMLGATKAKMRPKLLNTLTKMGVWTKGEEGKCESPDESYW